MANYVSLSVVASEQASTTTSVGFPSIAGSAVIVEQVNTPYTQAGVSVISRIILRAAGLNQDNKVFGSAQTVAAISTALGLVGYSASVSVYRSEQSTAATNVLIGNGLAITVQPVTGMTIAGVAILSKIVVPAHGLKQRQREYFSALSVAALVTALG